MSVQVVLHGCVSPGTPAVAASQRELSASALVTLNAPGGNIDISDVPLTFYGKTYTRIHVSTMNPCLCFCTNSLFNMY